MVGIRTPSLAILMARHIRKKSFGQAVKMAPLGLSHGVPSIPESFCLLDYGTLLGVGQGELTSGLGTLPSSSCIPPR